MTAPREIEDAPATGMPGRRIDHLPAAHAHSAGHPVPHKVPRARRPHVPDEERRQLKEAEAAFEGRDRRHDVDEAEPAAWDLEDEPHARAAPSRLFRD